MECKATRTHRSIGHQGTPPRRSRYYLAASYLRSACFRVLGSLLSHLLYKKPAWVSVAPGATPCVMRSQRAGSNMDNTGKEICVSFPRSVNNIYKLTNIQVNAHPQREDWLFSSGRQLPSDNLEMFIGRYHWVAQGYVVRTYINRSCRTW